MRKPIVIENRFHSYLPVLNKYMDYQSKQSIHFSYQEISSTQGQYIEKYKNQRRVKYGEKFFAHVKWI